MTISLVTLMATGPDKPDARIDFRTSAMLIRGPSETGKSYIRDCLWYLLGGDKIPKGFPQSQGYEIFKLTIVSDGQLYEIVRGVAGGDSSITAIRQGVDGIDVREPVDEDTGEFFVRLSGAQDKQVLRSKSKRGAVTGGDLRHWFLLSQPNMISEEATSGGGVPATQRVAAFHLFLTGSDDSAIQLAKTSSEVERMAGQIIGAELSLERLNADLPEGATREEVASALEKVDAALSAMTHHYDARASGLKRVRAEILSVATELRTVRSALDHSKAMVERFEMLDQKYRSDVERLGATWEGMSMFQALGEIPCPLCGTPADVQLDPRHLKQGMQDSYRRALRAEVEKVGVLRHGLTSALERERTRVDQFRDRVNSLSGQLNQLESTEALQLRETKVEFSEDPKSLAFRRSELSELLSKFQEEARLRAEIDRLTKSKRRTYVPLNRNVGEAAGVVADYAKELLQTWGFASIQTMSLDPETCDLIIDDRPRLGYGAGTRAVFLAALTIALMKYSLAQGHPHLGFVVIDSPLKSYADPKNKEQQEIAVGTVTDNFYSWMSTWSGPGQVVILENQEIQPSVGAILQPTEFTGLTGQGRPGFYPT
jgi:hypothetical protein